MRQALILLCSILFSVAVPKAATEPGVLAAMNVWKQAMMARDRSALEALYAPDLIYIHSSGKRETKAEAIETVVHGKDRAESIELSDISVKEFGTTALVSARTVMRVNNGETVNVLTLDVLYVWIKSSSRWQLAARHATRPNP